MSRNDTCSLLRTLYGINTVDQMPKHSVIVTKEPVNVMLAHVKVSTTPEQFDVCLPRVIDAIFTIIYT